MGDVESMLEREEAEALALIGPHLERLHGEYLLQRRAQQAGRVQFARSVTLVVEVPVWWPKQFDVGSSLFGMPIVRADVDEPRVMPR